MRLGIFAKIFPRPAVEDVFAAVARHRLHCAQFNFACAGLPSLPDHVERATADRIRKAAVEHRVEIAAVSGTFNMIHPDPKVRREGLRRLGIIAGACEHLGTNIITLCTGTRDPGDMWRHHPDNDTPEAWRDLVVTLTKALTTADKHGVTLGVEPETANVIDTARKARRLLDELKSPRLKIVLDAANLFHPGDLARADEVLEEAFDLLGGDLVLAHAKELGESGTTGNLKPGTGLLSWERYMALLASSGFAGPLIAHGFAESDATAGLAFLRERMAVHSPRRISR